MEPINFSVIYQDHHLLIVNKPAHLVIHPTYKHLDGTMWNSLLAYSNEQGGDDWQPPELPDLPEWAGAPPHIRQMLRERRRERQWKEEGLLPHPCLLHRLDKDTSGIVALARTEQSRRHIIRQFMEHTIVKHYLAVVSKGAPEWATPRTTFRITIGQGTEAQQIVTDTNALPLSLEEDEILLDGPLQRDPADRRRCIVGVEGQEAQTRVRVLARTEDFYLAEVQPITGRTHQIRAHLAAMGYAIVGDQVYAPGAQASTPQAALDRQFLHAFSLELRCYPDNERCRFIAPLADDLRIWLEHYFRAGLGVIDAKTVSI